VADHTEQAARLAAGKYIQQGLGLILRSLRKFVWQGLADQRRVMSDRGMFGQADYVLGILDERMGAIPREPEFRRWVRLDLLPAFDQGGG